MACDSDNTHLIDDFSIVSQRPYRNLCWAAVALSVDLWRNPGSTLTLCQVVEATPPKPTGCCPNPTACDHVGDTFEALTALGLAAMSLTGPNPGDPAQMDLIWAKITGQIGLNKVGPISIAWAVDNTEHAAVIWGYCDDSDRNVKAQDPRFDPITQPFAQFVTNYQGKHGRMTQLDTVA
jgi:hypothetical protein